MAKGYNKQIEGLSPNKPNTNNTFTTSRGKKVKILGLSQLLLDKIRGSVPDPERPTYTATTVAGKVETHFHDETTLQSDEDRAMWDAYLKAKQDAQNTLKERLVRAILMKGIEVDAPTDDGWFEMQEFLGLTVPTNGLERAYDYICTEVIGNGDDLTTIMEMVMRATGVPEEALAEAQASFRSAMAQVNATGPAGGQGE